VVGDIITATFTVPHPASLGHVLNEFVRNCALPYLEEESPEVRRAAALTCCRLFDKDPICYQASNHSIEIVSDVLDKLLTVGIADPGALEQAVNFFVFIVCLCRAEDSFGCFVDVA
jgi:FKBP12-rapamycin complex-associated protein